MDSASGTGKDSFTLAGAHFDAQRDETVVDVVRSWAPPFNPSGVIAEVCDHIKASGAVEVEGDRYAPGFVQEQCRANGITYRFSERDRSQLYLELLPLVNAQQVRLLDHPDLLKELRGLERRRGPSGRDKVDHRAGAHDDLANAVAGAVVLASRVNKVPWYFQTEGRRLYMSGAPPAPVATVPEPSMLLETVTSVASSMASTVKRTISTAAAKVAGAITHTAKRVLLEEPGSDAQTFWGMPTHPRLSPEEIRRLPKGSRSMEEQQRLDEFELREAAKRGPSALEEHVWRVGFSFPQDGRPIPHDPVNEAWTQMIAEKFTLGANTRKETI